MASLDLLDPRLRGPGVTVSSSQPGAHIQDDDDSEWEYEYSATETETFYVTLDLSKADFKAQEQVKGNPFPSRGSWQTHKASELFLNRRKAEHHALHNSAASSAASSDAERDDEDRPEVPDEGPDQQPSGAQDDDDSNHERVQILELHSENPIISYKGRVFSGQWSENTTTELLFTRHDDENPLPVLRHLDDGVDLLAASSARLNVTERALKAKASNRERQRASASLPQTVIPPVDLKASQERIDQRNFLADLIAIKRRKGETDEVTVIARSMQGKRAKAKAKGVRGHRRGRWTHADKLHPVRGLEEKSRRGGRRRGSGRARGKWALFPLEEPARDTASVVSSAPSPPDGESGISTPTPYRWDDLEEGQGDSPAQMEDIIEVDMEDEQDEQDGDEVEYDDNNDYDEDDEEDQDEMDEDED